MTKMSEDTCTELLQYSLFFSHTNEVFKEQHKLYHECLLYPEKQTFMMKKVFAEEIWRKSIHQ